MKDGELQEARGRHAGVLGDSDWGGFERHTTASALQRSVGDFSDLVLGREPAEVQSWSYFCGEGD